MAIISSFNSYIAVLASDEASVIGHLQVENGTVNATAEPDDITTTLYTWRQYRSEMSNVESVEGELPEDDTSSLEALSVAPGTKVNLYVRRGTVSGSGVQFDKVVGALYLGATKTIQPGRGRRMQVRFQGGTYSVKVSTPSALSTYMSSNSLS